MMVNEVLKKELVNEEEDNEEKIGSLGQNRKVVSS